MGGHMLTCFDPEQNDIRFRCMRHRDPAELNARTDRSPLPDAGMAEYLWKGNAAYQGVTR